MKKVTFIGGGSFGTALSVLLAKKGCSVNIYDKDVDIIEQINSTRYNSKYLKDVYIPIGVKAFEDIEKAIEGCEILVLSVPSNVIRSVSKDLKGKISKDVIIVSIAKGIEETSHLRLSEVIESELPENKIVVLSGPSHAEEVSIEIPTAVVVSSKDMKAAEKIQDLFMSPFFRVYTNPDLIGIEIGGAVKNIIAFAAGVSDGVGYGDNAKAALMTRGMKEMIKIGVKLGGEAETFYGLTGMGDLIVTCTSVHSRNRRAGILIGKGLTMDEAISEVKMVVEGIKATKAFYELKEKIGVDMPITDIIYEVLFKNKDVRVGVSELMNREKTQEYS